MSWLVMFTMLGSSVGISIYRHVCSTSGIIEMGLGDEDHCCGPMNETHSLYTSNSLTFEASCCEFQVTHINLPVVSIVNPILELSATLFIAQLPLALITEPEQSFSQLYVFYDHGPPLPGIDLNIIHSVFLI